MTDTPPYSRVYHGVIDDPRFESIYPDDHAFATWIRLLMPADAAYPSAVPVPRSCSKASLAKLVAVGIVEMAGSDHYRIHGLPAERERRREQSVLAGRIRAATANREAGRFASDSPAETPAETSVTSGGGNAGPARSPAVHQRHQPSTSTSRDEYEDKNENEDAQDARATLRTLAEDLTGVAYAIQNLNGGYGQVALAQMERHGLPEVERAWRSVAALHDPKPTVRQLLFEAADSLDPVSHQSPKDAKKAELAELKERLMRKGQNGAA